MNNMLFLGNIESPYLKDILVVLAESGKTLILDSKTFKKVEPLYCEKKGITWLKQWDWKDKNVDYYIDDEIIDVYPYLYPDALDLRHYKEYFPVEIQSRKSFSNFRLGFGVQEELFDLYLAHFCQASEIIYFDIESSLSLFNPVNQIAYRKSKSEFIKFLSKQTVSINERLSLKIRTYELTGEIPFFHDFTSKFVHLTTPLKINFYTIH